MHYYKKLFISIVAILLLIPSTAMASGGVTASEKTAPTNSNQQTRYIAYYFHNEYRCASCMRIEKWSSEIIQASFTDELKSGALEWKPINTDLKENKHFEKDYQLYTKSLIISKNENGKETKWENLEKVWHYLGSEEKFKNYVQTELKQFMEK